jgi:DNA-directed RNA polymerase subunit K/omega
MKSELLKAASEVIPNQGILINMVSRRVKQLALGHRPMIEHVPGLLAADIALTEIAKGKLTFELAPLVKPQEEPGKVVTFPGTLVGKKKAA